MKLDEFYWSLTLYYLKTNPKQKLIINVIVNFGYGIKIISKWIYVNVWFSSNLEKKEVAKVEIDNCFICASAQEALDEKN